MYLYVLLGLIIIVSICINWICFGIARYIDTHKEIISQKTYGVIHQGVSTVIIYLLIGLGDPHMSRLPRLITLGWSFWLGGLAHILQVGLSIIIFIQCIFIGGFWADIVLFLSDGILSGNTTHYVDPIMYEYMWFGIYTVLTVLVLIIVIALYKKIKKIYIAKKNNPLTHS